MTELMLNPETVEQLNKSFKQIAEVFKQLSEHLNEFVRSIFGDFDYTPGAIKQNTPYKSKFKFRLFDKRMRVYHCRNNC